eukprot:CAMPEP_0202961636 /NCGR_PEP_ID=MMETSP1396-20130829/5711_1 /ASSEMBLY_ACC=CAM_ASM_000872 /TAXON_ID= /ORGANISM="Pseudokeronopsis sp., Strain Brazil" /LENGTH=197 /DNA_ID=CAMNT_0049681617 /DNA_START=93 /DNA_END=686 /DNA_ORIENTATION=-
MRLYYWPIKARNYATLAVAQAGGLDLEFVTNFDFKTMKPTLPFGQLPYLEDGDVKIAQSNAILRYVAKKAGLDASEDPKWFGMSEMLIEEASDMYSLLAKANNSEDKTVAFNELLSADGKMAQHFGYLEQLLPGDQPFFRPDKRAAGGFAVAAVLDMVVHLEPTLLENFPKLKVFYAAMIGSSAFDGIRDLPMYFRR